jgi:type II secretory pathway pseudopilin PulG
LDKEDKQGELMNKKGITFVEVLVVLLIVGLAINILAPNVMAGLSKTKTLMYSNATQLNGTNVTGSTVVATNTTSEIAFTLLYDAASGAVNGSQCDILTSYDNTTWDTLPYSSFSGDFVAATNALAKTAVMPSTPTYFKVKVDNLDTVKNISNVNVTCIQTVIS